MGNKRQSIRAMKQSWHWLLVLRVKQYVSKHPTGVRFSLAIPFVDALLENAPPFWD
jgi:hypothetical protein